MTGTRSSRFTPFRCVGLPLAVLTLLCLYTIFFTAAGCTLDERDPTETIARRSDLPSAVRSAVDADARLQLGYAVYSRNCIGCHGINGDGKGPADPRLHIKPRDFTRGLFKFRSTPNLQLPLDEDLRRTIRQGLPGSSMPAFELLSDREIDAVIAFVKLYSPKWNDPALAPQRVMLPTTTPSDLMSSERILRGRFAYVAMGCQNCHGMTGRGDGPSAASLIDDWELPVRPYDFHTGTPKGGSSPMDVYRTFHTGVNPMPMYQSDTLGLVTRDAKTSTLNRLVPQERATLEPIVDALPTRAEVESWKGSNPAKYQAYSNDRAWDLVAYTLWLREDARPDRASLWPEGIQFDPQGKVLPHGPLSGGSSSTQSPGD